MSTPGDSALPPILGPELRVLFVGTSVATASSLRGHYYAGPGNQFWRLLAASGLTGNRLFRPEDDSSLPMCGLGLTDLVRRRAASSDALLTAGDFDVPSLLAVVEDHGPAYVAFNGLTAARVVGKFLRNGAPSLGLASWSIGQSKVYVLPSSSAAACDPRGWAPRKEKVDWWRELGRLSATEA